MIVPRGCAPPSPELVSPSRRPHDAMPLCPSQQNSLSRMVARRLCPERKMPFESRCVNMQPSMVTSTVPSR